ncbi:MAG TPA: hypothetical protein VIG85_11630 [Comamonas sp.]
MRKYATALLLVLTVLYPLAVYVALGRIAPQWLALMLCMLAACRALLMRQGLWWAVAAGAGVLAGVSWLQASPLAVKLYPVMVSLVLLGIFAYSLWQPPTVVERLARLQEPDLPVQAVHYTAQVTKVWCAFFVVNAAIALVTACWASDAVWALYNGLLSYVLMGMLMAGEWCVRQRVRRRHAQAEVGQTKRKNG